MARKILLADDSVTAQNMGRKILADAGYEVITVNNGSAALKKIGEQRPDLIVLDVYMPGYSGLEVCQRLKEAGDTARIPILLTVGKLEPFKPEEARRVRADAYIVKPFEASELLSALSKLEDKIVPRPESSKPGRFARATAALEESRYDKSMSTEEDAGWKSRIVFPKKKEKAAEADANDPAIDNPVNKDLRTVIAPKPEEHPPAPKHAEEERVNLGALAPEGLPKDVTPEEIAALAAAAAQVKGRIAEEKPSQPVQEMAVVAPPAETAPKAEVQAEIKEINQESKPEPKEEIQAAEPAPPADPAAEPAVTLAEPPKSEETEEKRAEPEVAASPAEVMAAIAGLEQSSPASGNGSSSHSAPADEPVTMAMAASDQASCWSAVAVAVAPEEAALSLEQEMQKAYAAFAAAESGHSAPVAQEAVSVPVSAVETPVVAPAVEPVPAPVEEIPAVAAPEAASPLAEIASAAKDAVSAAVTELASVAASYFSKEEAAPAEPVPVTPETSAPVVAEEAPVVEAKVEEPVVAEAPKTEMPQVEEVVAAKEAEPVAESKPAEQPEQREEIAAAVAEVPAPVAANEVSESKTAPEEATAVHAPESVQRKAGGNEEMAKKESELSATTAAAWASWRRIRETGSKPGNSAENEKDMEEPSSSRDEAAMAVAAGAESKPGEVAANFDADPEISSIVDSVLADMRPKIVEEIAKKLGKKK